jgi:hypothetical protein
VELTGGIKGLSQSGIDDFSYGSSSVESQESKIISDRMPKETEV